TLRSASEVRTLVAAMIWLTALQALLGVNQYFISFPAQRRAYDADPEQFLRDNGQPLDKDSPQRMQFENRLKSTEPFGTFSLANSLAGLLAPWLVATLAVGLTALGDVREPGTVLAAAARATPAR